MNYISRRRRLTVPHEDPRVCPKNSWIEEQQLNPELYKIYNTCVLHILSSFTPTSIDMLHQILIYEFGFSEIAVRKFVSWLSIVDTKKIEWEEVEDGKIRTPNLYLSPRIHVSASGPSCAYIPHKR
jgi:hypothetical protein